jgi:hypothetical protein
LPAKIIKLNQEISLDVPETHNLMKFDNDQSSEKLLYGVGELFSSLDELELDLFLTGPSNLLDIIKAIVDGTEAENLEIFQTLIKKGEKSFLRVSLHSKEVRDFLSPAGNLKDFLIEGITTNKNLLDYFSLEKIQYKQFKAGTKNYLYSKFTKKNDNLEIYDELRVHYKEKDSNYEIEGVQGYLYFWDKKDECLLKQKEISKEVFENFENRDIQKLTKKVINKTDKSGESFEIYTVIQFPKGGLIAVSCSIWSKKMKPINTLTVSIYTGDYK